VTQETLRGELVYRLSGVQWFHAVNEKSVVILGICEFRKNYCDFYWLSKNIEVTVSDILDIC